MKKSMFMVMSAAMLAIGSSGLAFSADSPAFSTLSAEQLILARGGDDLCPHKGKGDGCDDHVVAGTTTA